MYTKIETGKIESNKKQMVFVIPFARDCRVFNDYKEVELEDRQKGISLVLMQLRGDGKIGFSGGNVESGESLLKAVCRETKEEINHVIDIKKLKPLATYSNEDANIHSFSYELTYRQIKLMQRKAFKSKHFLAENQGSVLVKICNYGIDKGLQSFVKNNFAGTADMELKYIVEKENLLEYVQHENRLNFLEKLFN